MVEPTASGVTIRRLWGTRNVAWSAIRGVGVCERSSYLRPWLAGWGRYVELPVLMRGAEREADLWPFRSPVPSRWWKVDGQALMPPEEPAIESARLIEDWKRRHASMP